MEREEDITERKRAEEALRRKEEDYRTLAENSPDLIARFDRQLRHTYVNPAAARAGRLSAREYVGKTIPESEVPEPTAGRWEQRIRQVLETGQLLEVVDAFPTPDGLRYFNTRFIPELAPDGSVQSVLSVARDITERKRIEETLRRSEEHFRTLTENSSDIILVVDKKGIITDVSPSIERVMGYKPGELIGESGFNFIALADLPRAVLDFGKAVLITDSIVPNAFRVRHKDGSERILEGVGRSLFDNPAVAGFVMNARDVTERKRIEEVLQESEEKYRLLVQNANVGILVLQDGLIRFANPRALSFSGYSEEDLASQPFLERIHPDDRENMVERYRQRIAGKRDQAVYVFRFLDREGRTRWVEINSIPITWKGKLAVLSFLNDIEERRKAEEALRASEVMSRAVLEHSPVGISVRDQTGALLQVNEAWKKIWAISDAEIQENEKWSAGRSWKERCPYLGDSAQDLDRLFTPEGGVSILYLPELKIPEPRPGAANWISMYLYALRNQAGQVEKVVTLTQDISERKRAEQAVKESETKYRGIVDHSLLGFYITQGHIMRFCNQRLAEIFGYERPEELLGIHIQELVAPESWEAVDTQVQRRESGELDTVRYEFKGKRRDGALIDLEVLGGRILYEGKPAIQGSMIEITERKLLEAEFLQAQKMEAVGRLAGGVAHDFNNLLTSIMGYTDLLAKKLTEDDPSGPLRRYADNILSAANRAANLTQQLLSLSRRHAVQMLVLDLNGVVAEFERMLRRVIGEDIELTIHSEGTLGRVKADPIQIEQVLMNLAVNARDAMPGGGKLSIETKNVVLDKSYARRRREVAPGPYVMIAVSDTGHGMDAEVQSHLFEPFFTTKEKGKGTGLGLSTAYGIVKQTGGHIEVESAPGKGSAFKIYLPGTEEPPALLSSPQPQPPGPVEAELPRGVETVLLAEDEETVRSLAREVLRGAGYTVLEAGDGEEALRVAGSHPGPIHLLLTDVIMPRLGGPELARRLQPLRPDMRILFMSGYTDGDISSYGGLGTETSLLQKPFQPIVLARRVRKVLEAP